MDPLGQVAVVVSIVSGVVGIVATVVGLRRRPEGAGERHGVRSGGTVYTVGPAAGRAAVPRPPPPTYPAAGGTRPPLVAFQPAAAPPVRIRTNLVAAWFSVIVFYFGVPSLIYAYRARDAHRRGDYAAGEHAFRVSRRWSAASFVTVGAYLAVATANTIMGT